MLAPRPPVQSEIAILKPLLNAGTMVVDVGSNQGSFYCPFLRDGCNVISVEPNSRNVNYQRICYADYVARGQLTIYHRGCSDVAETAILMINDEITGSIASFDPRWKTEYFRDAYQNGLQETHELIRLDTLLAPHFADLRKGFGLLKVDTEGFDVKVLRSYFSGSNVPMPDFVMFELHTSEAAVDLALTGVDLLLAQGFDRFRVLAHYGHFVLADSPWLTHQQLLQVRYHEVNADNFGYGAGMRHGNIIATTSFTLAERESRRATAPTEGAAQW